MCAIWLWRMDVHIGAAAATAECATTDAENNDALLLQLQIFLISITCVIGLLTFEIPRGVSATRWSRPQMGVGARGSWSGTPGTTSSPSGTVEGNANAGKTSEST
eukprot:9484678-Pyramimonas_sp.AAC.1